MSPLAKKLHVALQKVAVQIAGSIRNEKSLKKISSEEAADFLAEIHVRVSDHTTDGSGPRALVAVADTLNDLCESGSAVRRAIQGMGLLDIILEEGDHICQPDKDNMGCFESKAFADYDKDTATLRIAAGLQLRGRPQVPKVGQDEGNIGTDFRSVLAHEIGHLTMDAIEQEASKKFRVVYDEQTPDYWKEKVSHYASKDDHELFAECFAAYTSVRYRGDLPLSVVQFFESAGLLPMVRKAGRRKASADKAVASADWSVVSDAITKALEDGYIESAGAEIDGAGLDIDFDVVNEEAAEYAEERAAQLVTDISNFTRDNLRADVTNAIEEGMTSKDLANIFADGYDFSASRAETIARTELSMANVQAHVNVSSRAGAVGKRWLMGSDHDDDSECDCSDNADEDVIAFDEDWASGDDWPPSHPNCVCDFQAIYADDPDAEDLIDDEEDDDE